MYGRLKSNSLGTGYLISFPAYDVVVVDTELNEFYIDVTPEIRYLVWNLKNQRFCILTSGRGGTLDHYNTEGEAQAAIEEFCSKQGYPSSIYKVIPFEYPGEKE